MTVFDRTPYKIEIEIYGGRCWKLFINGKEIMPEEFSIELRNDDKYPISYQMVAGTLWDIFNDNKPMDENW